MTEEKTKHEQHESKPEIQVKTTESSVFCTKIVAVNDPWTVAQFALIDCDGTMIYKGEHLPKGQSDYIDLESLNYPYDSEFKIKVIVEAGEDSTANEIIIYRRDYSQAYCFLTGTTFNTSLTVTY